MANNTALKQPDTDTVAQPAARQRPATKSDGVTQTASPISQTVLWSGMLAAFAVTLGSIVSQVGTHANEDVAGLVLITGIWIGLGGIHAATRNLDLFRLFRGSKASPQSTR